MNRILRILPLVILLLSATARADDAAPPIPGTPPAGWKPNKDHGEVVRQGLHAGLPSRIKAANVRVYSYTAPQGGGQVIFSVVDVGVPDDAAAATFARERIDDLKNTAQMMVNDGGGKARNINWQEKTDDAAKVIDALLEWAHEDNGTHSVVRAGWVKLPGSQNSPLVVEEVRAECILAVGRVEELRPACTEALASMMMPELAVRLPISAAVVEAPEPPTSADPPPSMTATPPGTQVPARPVVQKTPDRDWRAFYVLGALIILGAVLIWNRRRREEYDEDAEDKREEAEAHEREEDQ